MGNEPGRQGIQIEVAHAIGTYHHCGLLLVESIDNSLQRLRRRIKVVRIQLNGKTSTYSTVNSLVPTAANAQVMTIGHYDMKFVAMLRRQFFQNIRGAVRRVIVHHDNVIGEGGFLRQCTLHSVTDGLDSIEDRNHHRGLKLKFLFLKVYLLILSGINQRPNFTKMLGACLLHLYLDGSVCWVHIVKLLLARGTQVQLFFRIKILIQVE